jgi:hypothetical protein
MEGGRENWRKRDTMRVSEWERERETESVREHKDNAYAYAKRERETEKEIKKDIRVIGAFR